MNLSFEPLNLTEIVVAIFTLLSSLLVAYFTSKREMKKRVFEERINAYSKLYGYLRDLRGSFSYRGNPEAVEVLSKIEAPVAMMGSRYLMDLVRNLKGELAAAQKREQEMIEANQVIEQGEYELMREKGMSEEEIEGFFERQELVDDGILCCPQDARLTNEYLDSMTQEVIDEMRRSINVREFKLRASPVCRKIFKKLSPWK